MDPCPGSGTAADGGPAEQTHEHFTLLDSAGRLQIPPDLLAARGIKERVKLVEEGERIVIIPDRNDDEAAPADPAPPMPPAKEGGGPQGH